MGLDRKPGLAVIETHPVQYHAPVYRAVEQEYGIPVTAIYGSDFSVAGYRDAEFQADFAWDTDLLSGYQAVFLSTVGNGGGRTYDEVSPHGIAATVRRLQPRAILLVGYSPSFYQWSWLHAWRSRRPLLFRGETADQPQVLATPSRQLRHRLLQRLYGTCSKLLYIGERSRKHYAALGCPGEKLVFSPYCVDITPFQVDEAARLVLRAELRSKLGIREDQLVLLFSGKLSDRKGPDLLVEAVKALPPDLRNNTVILFVGSGDMQPALSNLADVEPNTRVHFAGFQNQKQLSAWYHAADILVLPSRRMETWGLVVNEALHHGLPCIVSDSVGCAPDLILPGVTGEVFETGSVQSLTAALAKAATLTGHPETRTACRKIVSDYSIKRAAEGIARAYDAVVS